MNRNILALSVALAFLPGCSLLSPSIGAMQESAATAVVQSSERVLCRDIPVGTWMRMYGQSAERMEAWRGLCVKREAMIAVP